MVDYLYQYETDIYDSFPPEIRKIIRNSRIGAMPMVVVRRIVEEHGIEGLKEVLRNNGWKEEE